jgi:hypothetical protein
MENQAVPKMKAPLILCEVLAYGTEDNKPKMKRMLESLQKQIDKSKTNRAKVRVLFYVDNGEKSIEEKKEWLINESNCVFYVFAPESYNVPDNYITNLMIGVNMFDRSLPLMRKEGIVMKKKQAEIKEVELNNEAPIEILD